MVDAWDTGLSMGQGRTAPPVADHDHARPACRSSASASSMPPPGTRALSAQAVRAAGHRRRRRPPHPRGWKPISAPPLFHRRHRVVSVLRRSRSPVPRRHPAHPRTDIGVPPPHASAAGTGRVSDRPPGLTGGPPLGIIKLCQVGSGDIAMPPLPPRKGAHLRSTRASTDHRRGVTLNPRGPDCLGDTLARARSGR